MQALSRFLNYMLLLNVQLLSVCATLVWVGLALVQQSRGRWFSVPSDSVWGCLPVRAMACLRGFCFSLQSACLPDESNNKPGGVRGGHDRVSSLLLGDSTHGGQVKRSMNESTFQHWLQTTQTDFLNGVPCCASHLLEHIVTAMSSTAAPRSLSGNSGAPGPLVSGLELCWCLLNDCCKMKETQLKTARSRAQRQLLLSLCTIVPIPDGQRET
jgi:hypothetical protein